MDAMMKAKDKQCTGSLPILPHGRKASVFVEVAENDQQVSWASTCSELGYTLMAAEPAQTSEILG